MTTSNSGVDRRCGGLIPRVVGKQLQTGFPESVALYADQTGAPLGRLTLIAGNSMARQLNSGRAFGEAMRLPSHSSAQAGSPRCARAGRCSSPVRRDHHPAFSPLAGVHEPLPQVQVAIDSDLAQQRQRLKANPLVKPRSLRLRIPPGPAGACVGVCCHASGQEAQAVALRREGRRRLRRRFEQAVL